MPYATTQELQIAAGGADKLAELADVNNDGNATTISAAILQAQTLAEQWIHSYAQKRFTVPFATVSDYIKTMSAQETIYRLKQNRGMVADRVKEEHEERERWLVDLARGLVSPGVDPEPPKSSAVVPQILDRSINEPISRDALKGFA